MSNTSHNHSLTNRKIIMHRKTILFVEVKNKSSQNQRREWLQVTDYNKRHTWLVITSDELHFRRRFCKDSKVLVTTASRCLSNTTGMAAVSWPVSHTGIQPLSHLLQQGTEQVQALADISRSALCCHSNETRAPIASPSNSAQLESTLTIPPKLHLGLCSSVGMWRGTDIQTHRLP